MAANTAKDVSNITHALKPSDVFCYICRGILIEPITVPCKHVFCKTCLEDSIPETSYSCPLCRRRISNWLRSAKKCDKLLNNELWKQIQLQYKDEVSAKLSGLDDGLDLLVQEQFPTERIITPVGEIGNEYNKMLQHMKEEMRHKRVAEEQASLQLIEQLKREESERRELEERASQELIMRLKEPQKLSPPVTRKSSKNIKATPSTSRFLTSTGKKSINTEKKTVGPMDFHIKRLISCDPTPQSSFQMRTVDSGRCLSVESNDSIASELHHFKPIRVVPKTPPKKSPDGRDVEVTLRKITPVKLFPEANLQTNTIASDLCASIRSKFSAFKCKEEHEEPCEPSPKKVKYSGPETESTVLKEINVDENSDSNSIGLNKSDPEGRGLDEMSLGFKFPKIGAALVGEENMSGMNELFDLEEQRMLEQRIIQERADRELALKLSREWYELRETRQTRLIPAVDRRQRKH